ncbi:unnamed protein product, partial [Effrenium voratum]
REAPVTPQALEAEMGKADFNCFVLDCLLRLSSDDFADVWVGLPRELRAVAWRPPPGIIVDIDSLKGPERMQMCAKLNTLRRERCVKLASPKQQAHFEDENWTITPMSRLVCSRFWECFRLIPLASTNESKWKATVKYLSKCPEKPESHGDVSRHMDLSTRPSDPSASTPSLPTTAAQHDRPDRAATPKKGFPALSALARASPAKPVVSGPPAPSDQNSEEFAGWVADRITADAEGLTLDSVEVKQSNRFPCKLKPSAALKTLPPLGVMSPVYQQAFQFYLRKFQGLLADVSLSSAPAKSLKRLCDALNLDVKGKDAQVPEILARLRATDMAALCLIALLRFWALGLTRGKMAADETFSRVGASIWLCLLRARSSRRSLSLLNSLGDVPWHGSWDYSWHSPAIYACVPIFPKFSSLGPFAYIGETDNFARRVAEHMSRLLCPHGAVQQPFFQFVRDDATRPDLLRMSVCEWLFFPLVHAPGDSSARKLLEKQWIKKIGTLNPPRVHVLARARSGLRPPHAGLAIFDAPRPVLRLRKVQKLDRPARHSVAQLALKSWKDGLRFTAAALAGHQFAGCKAAALSVWRLSRSAWIWVVHHISRHEDGWRRRRALQMLRRVTRTRRDLPQPISIMNCSVPWLGSNVARTLILQVVRRLLADWRRSGYWLPVMRHARLRAQWKATPTLADALCKGPALTELLGASRPPDCVCSRFLALDPRWPIVTVDGVSHIAASQGRIPWPDNLACFARLPANLCLPPKSAQVTSAVRAFLRSVRDRCKVADEDLLVESAVVGLSDALGELLTKNQNRLRAPVTWEQVEAARLFLRSFFVQVFDHNLCRFGAFCPALVRLQACRVLDFGDQASGMDFAWDAGRNYSEVLISLATVQHLPSHLQPARLSITATRSWSIGQPIILPKWKAPGIKWRLVVNKHSAPTTGLHSAVSKAIDVALNHMPRETWGDFSSSVSFLDLVADFNQRVQERFESCCVWTEAADMVDCYHHLPCDQAPLVWDAVATFLSNRGIHFISVPRRKGFGLGRFGQCLDAGWVCFSLDQIRLVLQNFAATNFISLPGYLGRELRGAPMGDALSGAVLRLFKWR